MHMTIMILLAALRETFLSRASLHLENLALRQQVAVLRLLQNREIKLLSHNILCQNEYKDTIY